MKLREMENTVVHTKTRAEYDLLMSIYEAADWKWQSGKKPTKEDSYNEYKEKTCIRVKKEICYAREGFYKEEGVKIISLRKFLKSQKLALNTAFMRPGLVVESKQVGCEYLTTLVNPKVRAVLIAVDRAGGDNEFWDCQVLKNGDVATAYGMWDNKSLLQVVGFTEPKKESMAKTFKVGQAVKVIGTAGSACSKYIGRVGSIEEVREPGRSYKYLVRFKDGDYDPMNAASLEAHTIESFEDLYVGYKFENGEEVIFKNDEVILVKETNGEYDEYTEDEVENYLTYAEGDTEEEVTELTMDEIAAKFGVDVSSLKIKKD